jgi:hypothetical protein
MRDLVPIDPALSSDIGEPFQTPAGTAAIFLHALNDDLEEYRTALLNLTTPESHAAWGDFSTAAELATHIGHWGISSRGQQPAPDVAYIAVMSHMGEDNYYALEDTVVMATAVVSLVHRPALGGWLVHAFGKGYRPADDLPRDIDA